MSFWLALMVLNSAQAARPKLFAILNHSLSVHETRARVAIPAPGDFAGITADWPLDPERSRDLENALEREFDRRLLTYSNNHVRAGTLPYVVVKIDVDQADIERHWYPTRSKSRRQITARVSLVHTQTGLETAPIRFLFELRRAPSDEVAKLRLIQIGAYLANKRPDENNEIFGRMFDDAVRVCQADLVASRR